jgi:hypothetical protein
MMSPGEVCGAIELCGVIAVALPWHEIGVVVAVLAFAYGLAASVAFFLYVYKFRDKGVPRRTGATRISVSNSR